MLKHDQTDQITQHHFPKKTVFCRCNSDKCFRNVGFNFMNQSLRVCSPIVGKKLDFVRFVFYHSRKVCLSISISHMAMNPFQNLHKIGRVSVLIHSLPPFLSSELVGLLVHWLSVYPSTFCC